MGAPSCTPRILLVDDDEFMRRTGARLIRFRLGAEVVEAVGGMQALSLWRRDPKAFDVIVIDLDMPEMNGVELLRRFGRLAPELPVIVWSAQQLVPAPPELGSAMALVEKSDDPALLVDAVDRALGSTRRRSGARPCIGALSLEMIKQIVGED